MRTHTLFEYPLGKPLEAKLLKEIYQVFTILRPVRSNAFENYLVDSQLGTASQAPGVDTLQTAHNPNCSICWSYGIPDMAACSFFKDVHMHLGATFT